MICIAQYLEGISVRRYESSAVSVPQPAVLHPTPAPVREDGQSRVTKSNLAYWVVVIGASLLLLWGWALAIKNIIHGTTVILG